MIQANKATAADQKAPAKIQGRVDAIEGRRLFGWVWDAVRPGERVLVRVLKEGRMVASATADMARVDLRRNGIGGMAEAVRDGVDGLHVRPDDPVALASAMRRAIETPRLWETLVRGIETPPDMAETADKHLAVYAGAKGFTERKAA